MCKPSPTTPSSVTAVHEETAISRDDEASSPKLVASTSVFNTAIDPPRVGYTIQFFLYYVGGFHTFISSIIATMPVVAAMTWVVPTHPMITILTLLFLVITCSVSRDIIRSKEKGDLDEAMIKEAQESSDHFLKRCIITRPHHQVEGTQVWQPDISIDRMKTRGLTTVGTSEGVMFHDLLTFLTEYKVQNIARLIKYDLGIGVRAHTYESTYRTIVNSTLACFINKESGHFEMYDSALVWKQTEAWMFFKVTCELDHGRQTCLRLLLQEHNDSTEKFIIEDIREISMILLWLHMTKSHVFSHYFANGVAEVGEVWPLAKKASDKVQAFGFGAIFSSPFPLLTTSDQLSEQIHPNITKEGLPSHRHLAKMLGKSSFMNEMSMNGRRRLLRMGIPIEDTEVILAATIMHSADHYYASQFLGHDGRSRFMQTDLTIVRNTFVPPNQYFTQRLLCRQHLGDPICNALYQGAHKVDPVFADNWLFISIAN